MYRYAMMLAAAAVVLGVSPSCSYSQQGVAENPAPASVAVAAPADETSIYGEVQSVSGEAGSMTVQYYDYDSDEERSVVIVTDAGTKLENVAGVGEIKKGDWVDVTYVSAGSGNLARSVFVEKEEEIPQEPVSASEVNADMGY